MFRKARYILLAAVLTGVVPLGMYTIYRHYHLSLWLVLVFLFIFFLLTGRWFYTRKQVFAPADWFLAAAIGWLLAGVMYDRSSGGTTVDVQVHDTMFVLSNFFLFDALAFLFGVAAAVYYLAPRLGNGPLMVVPGHIHFWASFIGMVLLAYVTIGWWGVVREEGFNAGNYKYVAQSEAFEEYFTPCVALVVLAAQGVFVFNLVYSALRRRI